MSIDEPRVDLVIAFRISTPNPSNKATSASSLEASYLALLGRLRNAGLKVATRPDRAGTHRLLLFVHAPDSLVASLERRERWADLVASAAGQADDGVVTPAERVRLVHARVTDPVEEGGAGVKEGENGVEVVTPMHDREFNHRWINDWTKKKLGWIGDDELSRLKDQFGEAIALYFAFVQYYFASLIIPVLLGLSIYALNLPYSAAYAIPLLLWSVFFVEAWRIRERELAVQWGTAGVSAAVHAEENAGGDWWKRELKTAASIPVLAVFAAGLGALLTGIFLLEAFAFQLYSGPGAEYIGFVPTMLFVGLVPQLLAAYQPILHRLAAWERHPTQQAHDASLTVKTFSLNALVAFGGLALSAWVYVPWGVLIMREARTHLVGWGFLPAQGADAALPEIKAERLHAQLFAYLVTNQGINFATEVIVPFVMRFISSKSSSRSTNGHNASDAALKGLEGPEGDRAGERAWLERVRDEVALPEYTLFGDYAEMATQFGYVVLWSICWPLAPIGAFVNNWFEIRSDAFKITQHNRRRVPERTDTVGPWLDVLSFIAWAGAITNSSLIYLFGGSPDPHTISTSHGSTEKLGSAFAATHLRTRTSAAAAETGLARLLPALLIALLASHAHILARGLVRRLLTKGRWENGAAARSVRERERAVRMTWVERQGEEVREKEEEDGEGKEGNKAFWQFPVADDVGTEIIRAEVKAE